MRLQMQHVGNEFCRLVHLLTWISDGVVPGVFLADMVQLATGVPLRRSIRNRKCFQSARQINCVVCHGAFRICRSGIRYL